MTRMMFAAGVLCLALTSAAAAAKPSEFIISYWCGPIPSETTAERYREVAGAGFNIAMPPCAATDPELNRKILDFSRQVGMKAIVADGRLLAKQPDDPDFAKNLDAVIADYSSHPALFGYFLTDEPNASAFPQLAAVNKYLLDKDPKRVPFVNLFPNYASEQQLGTPTYEEHVKQFIEIVKPALVSYDHYCLVGDTEREAWWENLEIVRRQCLAHDLPFVVIILSVPHGPYRNPTEADLRWQAYTSLAYGAKGILYFTYWTPSPQDPLGYHDAIITYEGKRTDHYDAVKRLNAAMSNWAPTLMTLKSTAVYHTGKLPAGTVEITRKSAITTKTEDLVVGEFASSNGGVYVMVVNRNTRKPKDVIFTAVRAHRVIEISMAGRERTVTESEFGFDLPVRTRLEAGEGKLYRIVR